MKMIMVGTNLGSLRSILVGLLEAGNHRSWRENDTCKYATKLAIRSASSKRVRCCFKKNGSQRIEESISD
ncbi:hypothetical protein SRHO_G00058770 [Serrasalmus rhombeus]